MGPSCRYLSTTRRDSVLLARPGEAVPACALRLHCAYSRHTAMLSTAATRATLQSRLRSQLSVTYMQALQPASLLALQYVPMCCCVA